MVSVSGDDGHGLISELVYGPVVSRRMGKTMGINLLPASRKYCSFNCVYCQLGWNVPGYKPRVEDFADLKKLEMTFVRALQSDSFSGIDAIVVSGNGEPTLYPEFSEAIRMLLRERNAHGSQARLICFTAGTELHRPEIIATLSLFDECHLKCDAKGRECNLPSAGFSYNRMIQHAAKLKNLVIQSCFYRGRLANVSDEDLVIWSKRVMEIRPRRVEIYPVSRKTAAKGIEPALPEDLVKARNILMCSGCREVRIIA